MVKRGQYLSKIKKMQLPNKQKTNRTLLTFFNCLCHVFLIPLMLFFSYQNFHHFPTAKVRALQ